MKKLKETINILFSTRFLLGLVMLVIIGAIVSCIVGFFFPIFKYPNEDNLVITFLGALAAFVVINNYSQMIDIRNQTDKRIKELEEKLEDINRKLDGTTKTIETDKEKIQLKFEDIEKIMYIDQGEYYRYYVIKQSKEYKMVEIRGSYIFELPFSKFLSRYDDETIKKKAKDILRNFGVPENLLKE